MPSLRLQLLFGLLVWSAWACAAQPAAPSSPAVPRHQHTAALAPVTTGTDYNPRIIKLSYAPGAVVPASWGHLPPVNGPGAAAAQPNPQLRQNTQYEPLTDAIAQRYGLAIRQQIYLGQLRCASFDLPAGCDGAALLARLRREAAGTVAAAGFEPLRHACYTPDDPDFAAGADGPQWAHWQIACNYAWNSTLGDPAVIIGVVDTGVRLTHEELTAQVIDPQLAYPDATCDIVNHDKSIEDGDGHGTFIAGLICASIDDGLSIAGAAPHCRVLPVKISNSHQTGNLTDLIAGALLAGQLGAKIVNFSWGGTNYDDDEAAMVDDLTADGVLFVAAAGNDASYDVGYPARLANAVCVGATDKLDHAAWFSNWGPDVDIAAPGTQLKSASWFADDQYETDGSGTSYAVPLVASGAALLWSYNPALTLPQVRQALQQHGGVTQNFATPVKRLDISQALLAVGKPPLVPSLGAVVPAGEVTLGLVPGVASLDVHVVDPVNVSQVLYRLDLDPVGTDGPEDIVHVGGGADQFPASFDLTHLKNQTARLRVECHSTTGDKRSYLSGPLWIFNQRGDIDGDGVVDAADIEALRPLLGLTSSDSGYVAYADTDQDGAITEADAAAVGYFFGQTGS